MKKRIGVLSAMILTLAACNGQPSQTKQPETQTAPVAVSAPAPVASSDVAKNQVVGFEDKMGDENLLPEGIDAKDVVLLQHNANDNITVYQVKFAHKGEKDKIYQKLNKVIQNDTSKGSLWDVTSPAGENAPIVYNFSQTDEQGKSVLNETCVLEVKTEYITTSCAYSPTAKTEDLAKALIAVLGSK